MPEPEVQASESDEHPSGGEYCPEALCEEIRDAIDGEIEAPKPSARYRRGLLGVAAAMLLLTAVYLAAMAGFFYGLYAFCRYAVPRLWNLGSSPEEMVGLFVLIGVCLFAWGLIAFPLLAPLWPRSSKGLEPRELKREDEPLFFEFIEQVCRAVRVPVPRRVEVNLMANAGARVHRGLLGFLRYDLALAIGLPLVSGLSSRQLAGVLAHELGHFSQNAGMRMTFLIRRVNAWFAHLHDRAISYDERMNAWAEHADSAALLFMPIARLLLRIMERIFRLLRKFGASIASYMLHQMEYSADLYEIRLSGSECFIETMHRIALINVNRERAASQAEASWHTGRLPDQFSLYVSAMSESITPRVQKEIDDWIEKRRKETMDTHPSDDDRIQAALAEDAPGILQLEVPSTQLFRDFRKLDKAVTRDYYKVVVTGEVAADNLLDAETLASEQKNDLREAEACARYFQHLVLWERPFYRGPLAFGYSPNIDETVAEIRAIRDRIESSLEEHRKTAKRYWRMEERLYRARYAMSSVDLAGDDSSARMFAARRGGSAAGRSEKSYVELRAACAEKLDAFADETSKRMALAVRLLNTPEFRKIIPDGDALCEEAPRLLKTVVAMREWGAAIAELKIEFPVAAGMAAHFKSEKDNQEYQSKLYRILMRCKKHLEEIHKALGDAPYPFKHASGEVSIARYALDDFDETNKLEYTVARSETALDRIFALHNRLLRRLAIIGESVETAAGLEPMPEPPEPESEDRPKSENEETPETDQ